MAIVPKRKTSKHRKKIRNSHSQLYMQNLIICKNCGESIQQHIVCKFCGYYKGRQVTKSNIKK